MTRISEGDSELELPELPELDAYEERLLVQLLEAAWSPRELDPEKHERLLQAALEDPFAAASPEELVESERLRRALDGQGDHADLRLARALSAAFAPKLAGPLPEPQPRAKAHERRSGQLIFYRFAAVTTALAVAAAVLLALTAPLRTSAPPTADLTTLALAQSRSTAALFQANSASAPSERIDRIASARTRELRDNRFALWGVR